MLSNENADVNLGMWDPDSGAVYPIWYSAISEIGLCNEVFEAVVRHPTFDPNRPNFDAFSNAPLPLHQAFLDSFYVDSNQFPRVRGQIREKSSARFLTAFEGIEKRLEK